MRRDRVLVSRQRSPGDPVSRQPPDRLAARLTAVPPRVPVAERLRHDLRHGGVIAVRVAHVRPLVTPPGHRVGDVVDAAADAEQVIGVTARLTSTERPVRRRVTAHQEAELRVVRHRFGEGGTGRVTLAFPPGSDRLIQRIKDSRIRRGGGYAGVGPACVVSGLGVSPDGNAGRGCSGRRAAGTGC